MIMNESFNKFRKKILIESLIKSLIISISLSVIAFSGPKLIVHFGKLNVGEFFVLWLILISVWVLLLSFGLSFLILFPRKLKTAKRLDKELNLNQKVQTMIEFEKEESPMINLQREDTLNILSNISIKKLAMKFSIFIFVLLGFACALGVTVVAVENYEKPSTPIIEPEKPTYNLDNWTVRALLDLIEVVEKSNVQADLKQPVIKDLENLLDVLETVEYESEMVDEVNSVIKDIDHRLDVANSANEIFTELKSSESPIVRELVTQINAFNITNVNNTVENFYVYLCGDSSTITEAILAIDSDFRLLITKSNLNQEDPLVSELLKFANALSDSTDSSGISNVINSHKDNIVNLVKLQTENKNIMTFVIDQLRIIFGLHSNNSGEEDGSGDVNNPTITPIDPPKIDENENQGGYGTGEPLFGSDDIMFDIEKGSVEYGEVINKYYGELVGMFNDGTIPEEYKEVFEKYFNTLYGLIEEENK